MQDLNQGVIAEGRKKVDVLQATKDFKKGIYGLQWEHTWGVMEVFQPTHTTPPPPCPNHPPSNLPTRTPPLIKTRPAPLVPTPPQPHPATSLLPAIGCALC